MPGQHVAGARRGQPRRAVGVDGGAPVGRGDDGVGALEHDDGAPVAGAAARARSSFDRRFHESPASPEQTRELALVRRQDDALRRRRRPRGDERRAASPRRRRSSSARRRRAPARRRASAAATIATGLLPDAQRRADHDGVAAPVGEQAGKARRAVASAHHDRVERGGVHGQRVGRARDRDEPGPDPQRAARRQPRRAGRPRSRRTRRPRGRARICARPPTGGRTAAPQVAVRFARSAGAMRARARRGDADVGDADGPHSRGPETAGARASGGRTSRSRWPRTATPRTCPRVSVDPGRHVDRDDRHARRVARAARAARASPSRSRASPAPNRASTMTSAAAGIGVATALTGARPAPGRRGGVAGQGRPGRPADASSTR